MTSMGMAPAIHNPGAGSRSPQERSPSASRAVASVLVGPVSKRPSRGPKLKAATSDEQYVLSAFEPLGAVRSASNDSQRAKSPPRKPLILLHHPLVPRGRGPTDSAVLEAAAMAGARAALALDRASGAASNAAAAEAAAKNYEVNSPSTTKASETSLPFNDVAPGFVDTFAAYSPSDGADRGPAEAQEYPHLHFRPCPSHGSSSGFEVAQPGNFYEHPVIEAAEFQSILGSLEEKEPPWMPSGAGAAAQDAGMRDIGMQVAVSPGGEEHGVFDEPFSPAVSSKVAESKFASWDYRVPHTDTRVGAVATSLALKAEDFVPPPLPLSKRMLESPLSQP